MTVKFVELDRPDAAAAGFATYNGGRHICLELPQEATTISVKSPDGKLTTFSFIPRHEGEGHQCVDVVHHGDVKNKQGNSLQKAAFLGQGPTNARTTPEDESPTTVIVIQIPK